MKLSLTLEPRQWIYIQKLLRRQDKSYTSQLSINTSEEERLGITTYRKAVDNLANQIEGALKKL